MLDDLPGVRLGNHVLCHSVLRPMATTSMMGSPPARGIQRLVALSLAGGSIDRIEVVDTAAIPLLADPLTAGRRTSLRCPARASSCRAQRLQRTPR